MQIMQQIMIHAPADKVWRVLAHDFANIGVWASAISESRVVSDMPIPEGAEVGGRVCSASGFGQVQEAFIYYDEQGKRFGYQAIEGLPSYVKQAVNNWSVRPQGAHQSVVDVHAELRLSIVPGIFLAPLMKAQLRRLSRQTMEELKYYIEYGQPHPRKLKI
jgi:uncharacterized membrane protein